MSGLLSNDGQITKGEAKHVVLVVILGFITIVVKRSHADAQDGVNSRRFIAVGLYFNGVLVQFLDAGDIGNALAAHGLVLGAPFADEGVFGHAKDVGTVGRLNTGILNNISIICRISFFVISLEGWVFFLTKVEGFSGIGGKDFILHFTKAPKRHTERDLQTIRGLNFFPGVTCVVRSIGKVIGKYIIHNSFYISFPIGSQIAPEGFLLFLGPGIGFCPFMVDSSSKHIISNLGVLVIHIAGGLRAVIIQTDDGIRTQGRRARIAGVQISIVGEDHIISSHGLAIAELQVFAQFCCVGGNICFLIILNLEVSSALILIVSAIIGNGFSLDGVVDDTAHAVRCHQ